MNPRCVCWSTTIQALKGQSSGCMLSQFRLRKIKWHLMVCWICIWMIKEEISSQPRRCREPDLEVPCTLCSPLHPCNGAAKHYRTLVVTFSTQSSLTLHMIRCKAAVNQAPWLSVMHSGLSSELHGAWDLYLKNPHISPLAVSHSRANVKM